MAHVSAVDPAFAASRPPRRTWGSLAVGIAAFAFYLALTPHATGDGDSSELTLVLAVGGVPHPPGYPLYAMMGHLWVTLAHGVGMGWARAANSFSAIGAGAAIACVHALSVRLLGGSHLAPMPRTLVGLLPTGLFAFHPVWLEQATVAEVHAWHIAILAALALAALDLVNGSGPALGDVPPPSAHPLLGFGLLCGVGLVHHLTSVLFVAPLAVTVLWALGRAKRLPASRTLAFVGGAAFPLLAQGYTAYRAFHPAAFQWPLLEPTAGSIAGFARGSVFSVFLGHFAPSPDQVRSLGSVVLPAIIGTAALVTATIRTGDPSRRSVFSALLVATACQLAFFLGYGVPDCVPYVLPILLTAAIGLAAIVASLARRAPHAIVALPLVIAGVVAAGLAVDGLLARHRRVAAEERAILARWRSIPYARAIVLWQDDRYPRLLAAQLLDLERPALDVENPAMLTWPGPRAAFVARHGFDPLAGLELHDDSDLPRIAPNIARQTRLPVLDFARVTAR